MAKSKIGNSAASAQCNKLPVPPVEVAEEIMERIRDVWDELVAMPEAAAMAVITVAAIKPVRAAVEAETERLKPWLKHKSDCGKCKDPQCGDSTWDHFCGETSDCTCGFAAAIRRAPEPSAEEE